MPKTPRAVVFKVGGSKLAEYIGQRVVTELQLSLASCARTGLFDEELHRPAIRNLNSYITAAMNMLPRRSQRYLYRNLGKRVVNYTLKHPEIGVSRSQSLRIAFRLAREFLLAIRHFSEPGNHRLPKPVRTVFGEIHESLLYLGPARFRQVMLDPARTVLELCLTSKSGCKDCKQHPACAECGAECCPVHCTCTNKPFCP